MGASNLNQWPEVMPQQEMPQSSVAFVCLLVYVIPWVHLVPQGQSGVERLTIGIHEEAAAELLYYEPCEVAGSIKLNSAVLAMAFQAAAVLQIWRQRGTQERHGVALKPSGSISDAMPVPMLSEKGCTSIVSSAWAKHG